MKILPGQVWQTKPITDCDYSYLILSLEGDHAATLYREGLKIWRRTRKISELQEAFTLFFDLCANEARTQAVERFQVELAGQIEDARFSLNLRQSMLDELKTTTGKVVLLQHDVGNCEDSTKTSLQ